MNHGQTDLLPCMGGWCAKREHCANYHAATDDKTQVERICEKGKDGESWMAVVMLPQRVERGAEA